MISRQLMRSATSVGANYRAASRARSAADSSAKMEIFEEEADESLHWKELLEATVPTPSGKLPRPAVEASQTIAMVVASNEGRAEQPLMTNNHPCSPLVARSSPL
ncbi:MAG: four helix bundle protein [candidate division WOR-3 bacterium]